MAGGDSAVTLPVVQERLGFWRDRTRRVVLSALIALAALGVLNSPAQLVFLVIAIVVAAVIAVAAGTYRAGGPWPTRWRPDTDREHVARALLADRAVRLVALDVTTTPWRVTYIDAEGEKRATLELLGPSTAAGQPARLLPYALAVPSRDWPLPPQASVPLRTWEQYDTAATGEPDGPGVG